MFLKYVNDFELFRVVYNIELYPSDKCFFARGALEGVYPPKEWIHFQNSVSSTNLFSEGFDNYQRCEIILRFSKYCS